MICKYCNVDVDEELEKCPLCLKVVNTESYEGKALYPKYPQISRRKRIKTKIALFLSIAVISVTMFINLYTNRETLWFIYVAASILYLWLLVENTIRSSAHTGAKILLQVIGVAGLSYFIDLASGNLKWSVNYVIPFLVIAGTLAITIIIFNQKMRWSEYIGFQIAVILLGFIPIIFYFLGIVTVLWVCICSALYALLTLIFMFIFSNKKLKMEFVSRFHF